ncbi:MAG: hypothetical protein OM95_16150 [Bdellovibrio sp. ArHS]|uniref:cation:proton antiporter n=1 Tax=Bdellovibrio sp. ArHS TaxID=1569284 RepID=UPI0005837EC9|nr:cation:proton antiporter [Bdellovibrio sp. ArHS]KHD87112.1 MAG: hypothetical protein OM95_16150 [Bdellovibrio sp. ArHS]
MKLLLWIVFGLILGPGLTDISLPSWLADLSQLAGAIFLFFAGWELQFIDLRKEARFYGLVFLGSFVIPFAAGYFFFEGNLFISVALGISALPVAIQILKEKNIYNTVLARRTVTLASLCDIVAWMFLAFLLPEKDILSWLLSHWVVLAFFVGLLWGRWRPPPRHWMLPIIQMWICAPIFFIVLGWKINILHLFSWKTFGWIFGVAVLSKVLGTYVFARIAGQKHAEAFNLSFLLNARGAMEILAASYAYNAQLISGDVFAALVLLGLVTALMAIPTVKE